MINVTVWEGTRDDLIEALGKMGKRNGFYLDYGEVQDNSSAAWYEEADYEKPIVHVAWRGPAPGDELTGHETAAGRMRQYDRFDVSVACKDLDRGDHEKKGNRIMADIYRATLVTDSALGTNRNRGNARTTTHPGGDPIWDASHGSEGGLVVVPLNIRNDFLTGQANQQG